MSRSFLSELRCHVVQLSSPRYLRAPTSTSATAAAASPPPSMAPQWRGHARGQLSRGGENAAAAPAGGGVRGERALLPVKRREQTQGRRVARRRATREAHVALCTLQSHIRRGDDEIIGLAGLCHVLERDASQNAAARPHRLWVKSARKLVHVHVQRNAGPLAEQERPAEAHVADARTVDGVRLHEAPRHAVWPAHDGAVHFAAGWAPR